MYLEGESGNRRLLKIQHQGPQVKTNTSTSSVLTDVKYAEKQNTGETNGKASKVELEKAQENILPIQVRRLTGEPAKVVVRVGENPEKDQ